MLFFMLHHTANTCNARTIIELYLPKKILCKVTHCAGRMHVHCAGRMHVHCAGRMHVHCAGRMHVQS